MWRWEEEREWGARLGKGDFEVAVEAPAKEHSGMRLGWERGDN